MDIIIIEGNEQGSEYSFWSELIGDFLNDTVLVSMRGATNIGNTLRDLLNSDEKYENMLICYDTTALPQLVRLVKRNLGEYVERFEADGTHVDVMNHYCYEDMLLRFQKLPDWLFCIHRRSTAMATRTFHAWRHYVGLEDNGGGTAWENIDSELRSCLIELGWIRKEEHISKETLAGRMLLRVQMHTTFYTKDVKSGRSDCWLCDCMEEEKCLFSNGSMSIQQAAAWKCGFYDNKVSAQYKIETLLRESEILKKLYGIDWIGKHLP